jgi:hypothetical protein
MRSRPWLGSVPGPIIKRTRGKFRDGMLDLLVRSRRRFCARQDKRSRGKVHCRRSARARDDPAASVALSG